MVFEVTMGFSRERAGRSESEVDNHLAKMRKATRESSSQDELEGMVHHRGSG